MKRVAIAACALLLSCAHESLGKPAGSASAEKSTNVTADSPEPFEVIRVDDSVDPIADVPDSRIPFGSGIAVYQEMSPLGPKHVVATHFARLVPRPGESSLANRSRFLQWADHAVTLPRGDRFGFEDVVQYDPETNQTTPPIGLRTYVLSGEPIVTHRDVADASIVEGDEGVPEIEIVLRLNERGAQQLELATGLWIDRRLAILSHGKIDRVPVVKAPIRGGDLRIGIGPRSDANVKLAKKMVEEILQK